jgi:hypothetical protein
MSTFTREVMNKQKKVDWFSALTNEKRAELLLKHKIDRKIEDETLMNEDVFLIYDSEHESCESCEKECESDNMRMGEEDGNWFCKDCITEMNLCLNCGSDKLSEHLSNFTTCYECGNRWRN